jgi:hypothetical protein
LAESFDGVGLNAFSDRNVGARGQSKSNAGVFGTSETGPGVSGESNDHAGVLGTGHIPNGRGVQGQIQGADGTYATFGFFGGRDAQFKSVVGVYGESPENGVFGKTASSFPGHHAVYGQNDGAGRGVTGVNSTTGSFGFLGGRDPLQFRGHVGVYGESPQNGVFGRTASKVYQDNAVYGQNDGAGHGVAGVNTTTHSSGFLGGTDPNDPGGIGVYGYAHPDTGGKWAGRFDGNVKVTGDIILNGGDCAEDFDIAGLEAVEAGTVMVIKEDGALKPSDHSYDKKVAGVVSGAGDYKPAIVLDRQDNRKNRASIALVGKVYCKVDAQFAPIEVGDLLTTSPTPGHAMKADDPLRALGTIIGKALRRLDAGQGMVPILVALQ